MSYDHQVQISKSGHFFATIPWAMRCWLDKHLEEPWFYDANNDRIFFRTDEDKIKFILRWI